MLVLLSLFDLNEKKKIQTNVVLSVPISLPTPAPYPILNTSFFPDVSAESAIVLDANTNIVLFEKNADMQFSPASTTKIMTALVALNYYSPNAILTVFTSGIEGSIVGFEQGEQVTFSDMLYAMLLPSGNDAAVAIAQNYRGGEDSFILQMNKKAQELSLFNTHFVDPDGLSENDYTTAHDLARLGAYALHNPVFAKIVRTKHKTITTLNFKNTYQLSNLNVLLGLDNVTGIKTGYTDEAGQVLVTSQQFEGHTIIIVVMKSQDRFGDTQAILQTLQNKINFVTMHP